jgi:4-hydroxyphenylpyruvate dioxygenase
MQRPATTAKAHNLTDNTANSNPMGTDGFEFIEYTATDTQALEALFDQMGFQLIAHHRSKDVALYRQGSINFIVNRESESFARTFAQKHGPSISAFSVRVLDAAAAFDRAVRLGAVPFQGPIGPMELNIPAIMGIGGSLIYLVDRYNDATIYDVDFNARPDTAQQNTGVGLTEIDHLTHNVFQGHMDEWAEFYERLFGFHETRFFDIEGKLTGLRSRAMTSPCGKIRIPINESSDDQSQIVEYLDAYKGEGIQHIALSTNDIYRTVEALRDRGIPFLDPPPDSYYDAIEQRLPNHGEDVNRLKSHGILIDGETGPEGRRLLQIFTATVIGPIFFEIIQRKGDEGFGEGNFKALFEAMEQDQIQRGVLKG